MQTGTFYISSAFSNRKQVLKLAKDLEEQGMRWVNGWCWATQSEELQERIPEGPETRTIVAARDISGAVGASLFVSIISGEEDKGTFFELGARVGNNREAHIVLQGHDAYCFYYHPCVVLHKNWRDFILAMFPHSGYPFATSIGMTD